MKFKNKKAIVTGASGSIGQAIAVALAEQGANVVRIQLDNYISLLKNASSYFDILDRSSTTFRYPTDDGNKYGKFIEDVSHLDVKQLITMLSDLEPMFLYTDLVIREAEDNDF